MQYGVNGADHNFFNTIWVGDDNSTTTDTACAASLPGNVRNVVLRGCGHMPTWDDPAQVAALLLGR